MVQLGKSMTGRVALSGATVDVATVTALAANAVSNSATVQALVANVASLTANVGTLAANVATNSTALGALAANVGALGNALTAGAMTWTPADVEGGWWLDSRYGVPANVATWASRGMLNPAFVKSPPATGLSVDATGVLFAGGGNDYLYESNIQPDSNSQTVFAVFRPTNTMNVNGNLLGKYYPGSNQRCWLLLQSVSSGNLTWLGSSDGLPGVNVPMSPGSAQNQTFRYHTCLVRKTGNVVDAWFNGVQTVKSFQYAATIFAAGLPVGIGTTGVTGSTPGGNMFAGHMRHLGYYNAGLSDSDTAKLLAWLQREAQWFTRGPAFAANAAGYPSLTVLNPAVVAAPDGTTAAQAAPTSHRYRHNVAVGKLSGSNRVWVSHASAPVNEASNGQQLHVEYSDDQGATWTSPAVAVDSIPGAALPTSRGFYEYGNKLYVVAGVDSPGNLVTSTYRGLALVARECLSSGALGNAFRVSVTGGGYTGMPAYDANLGPPLFALANAYGTWGGDGPLATSPNASWVGWTTPAGDSTTYLTDPATASVDGSSNNLVRVWRCTQWRGNAAAAEVNVFWTNRSYDGGATWTQPTPTDVPNSPAPARLLRLSDGRFALVCNALDFGGVSRGRLSLMTFDVNGAGTGAYVVRGGTGATPAFAGTGKSGGPAAPGAVQVDNYLHVGYSVFKERVEAGRVRLPPPAVLSNVATSNVVFTTLTAATVTADLVGNVTAAGNVVATGTITAAGVTAAAVTATGNVAGGLLVGNVLAAAVTATGNVAAAGVTATAVSATGNVAGGLLVGNVLAGAVTATGNVAAAGVTAGAVTATGNVAGGLLVGNVVAAAMTNSGKVLMTDSSATGNTGVQFTNPAYLGSLVESRASATARYGLGVYGSTTRVYAAGASGPAKVCVGWAQSDTTFLDAITVTLAGSSASATSANVGINTAGPAAPFHVVGNLQVDGNVLVNGSVYASGDITALSDRRLKAGLRVIEGASGKLAGLTGYTYDRVDAPGRRYAGLVAQDVLEVLPEAVHSLPEPAAGGAAAGLLSVAYGPVVALLVEAVKDLTARVAALEGAPGRP
jgi:hypothetical protein